MLLLLMLEMSITALNFYAQNFSLMLAISMSFIIILFTQFFIMILFEVFKINLGLPLIFVQFLITVGLFYIQVKIPFHSTLRSIFPLKKEFFKNPLFLFTIVGFFFLTIIALNSPPNTWDSMTYHLPRVMEWKETQSIKTFAAYDLRQITLSPFAEMVLFLISWGKSIQNDSLMNLLQLFSLVIILINLVEIMRLFSFDEKKIPQMIFLAFTIPMGIMQSTTTQNDLFLSALLISNTHFLLALISLHLKKEKENFDKMLFFWMISASLAVATKSTAFIYLCFPGVFLTILGFIQWKQKMISLKKLFFVFVVFILILSPNLFFMLNNYQLMGHFFSDPHTSQMVSVSNPTLKLYLANFIKHYMIHLATPWENINHWLLETILKICTFFHLEINHPNISFGIHAFFLERLKANEDTVNNPIHFLLAAWGIILIAKNFSFVSSLKKIYTALFLLTLLLFPLLLKWQPWISRLQLPLFFLALPIISEVLMRETKAFQIYQKIIFVLLLIMTPTLIFNQKGRPLLRQKNIFNTHRLDLYYSFRESEFNYHYLSQILANNSCQDIGLYIWGDEHEYPLWVMAKTHHPQRVLRHIWVSNNSHLHENKILPCLIIKHRYDQNDPPQLADNYRSIWLDKNWELFEIKGPR